MKEFLKRAIYGVVDAVMLGRGIPRTISGEMIRFPARWSRYYPSSNEPAKSAFLREQCKPGMTVLDIGAHIGLFSVLMARAVGPTGTVFSFEPSMRTRTILNEVVALNQVAAIVTIRSEAVAEFSGTSVFFETGSEGSNANSLLPRAGQSSRDTVETVSVDDFAQQRAIPVHGIKIDAEGSEIGILKGASQTISRFRPFLTVEVHPSILRGASMDPMEIWSFAEAHRFVVLHENRFRTRDWFAAQTEYFEIQLVPAEQFDTDLC